MDWPTVISAFVGSMAAGLIAASGFLIKRYGMGGAQREVVQDTHEYLRLDEEAAKRGWSAEDAIAWHSDLRNRRKRVLEIEAERIERAAGRHLKVITQLEMNAEAKSRADEASYDMLSAAEEFRRLLSSEAKESFDAASEAWQVYAEKQAWASSAYVEGGSMRPLVYANELESLASARAAYLREQVERWNSLYEADGNT